MTLSPASSVIYSIKFLLYNFLGPDFLAPKSNQQLEKLAVLGLVEDLTFNSTLCRI